MGAHVSAVPNHQIGRITPIATRAAVAFFGVFGYELDPTALAADDRRAIADQIAFYKANRDALPARPVRPPAQPVRGRRQPDRLDGRRAGPVAGRRRLLPGPQPAGPGRPTACGSAASTRTPSTASRGWPDVDDPLVRANAGERGGDELMGAGLSLGADRHEADEWGDFRAWLFVLEAV